MALPKSKFAFLTLPRYSMIALSNAVEPLRMANIVTGTDGLRMVDRQSRRRTPTAASNGLQLSPDDAARAGWARVDILFVCGGVDVQEVVSPPRCWRRCDASPSGACRWARLCTGGYALANAGLLDTYRATIHWENLSALREEFPRIHAQRPALHASTATASPAPAASPRWT